MDFYLNIIILLSWFIVIFLTYFKFGIYENIFSPLNLYILINIAGIIIFLFFLIEFKGLNYLPTYFKEPSVDMYSSLITILLYFLSSSMVYILLKIFNYKPLCIKGIKKLYLNKDIKIMFIFFSLFYTYILLKSEVLHNLSYENLYKFRFEMSHGYIVFFNLFGFSMFFLVFLFLFRRLYFQKKWLILFILLLPVWFLLIFLNNARGPFVFGTLFALSLYPHFSLISILKNFFKLRLNKKIFLFIVIIAILLILYQEYSIHYRAQEGVFYELVLQRIDNFIASYIAINNNLGGFKIENIFYPFIYLIPRAIFPEKPFPPNGELSAKIFGANLLDDDAWSVNFGLAAESYYVSFGFLTPLYSLIIAIAIIYYSKILSKIYSKNKLDFLNFIILTSLYLTPFGIVMGGVFTPSIGNLILILLIKFIITYTKKFTNLKWRVLYV